MVREKSQSVLQRLGDAPRVLQRLRAVGEKLRHCVAGKEEVGLAGGILGACSRESLVLRWIARRTRCRRRSSGCRNSAREVATGGSFSSRDRASARCMAWPGESSTKSASSESLAQARQSTAASSVMTTSPRRYAGKCADEIEVCAAVEIGEEPAEVGIALLVPRQEKGAVLGRSPLRRR